MKKKFYITCAIPYVNAAPHVGHALEFVQGDTIARYHRLLGEDVILLSGGDENALKNVTAAESAGEEVKPFVDKNNKLFENLVKNLNCQFNIWQKGSDTKKHFSSSQKLWQLCNQNGDIYQKEYEGLYCVGCEVFYTPDELNENGECFEHPGKPLQKVKEKNYFFRLSKYQDQLINLISSDKLKIHPEERKNEILSFLKQPLKDISISRSNERAKNWGVPVPRDDTQKIYVWFDALNIYQSGIGFGWDEKKYKKYWPADVHIIGKGITRFHAVYWPAFLLSAGLPLPKSLFVHGYFTVNGQKMSKTLGNVTDPNDLIKKYGADTLRYYLLAKFSPFSDGDFSESKLKEVYNGDLANGLGNLVSRIAKLAELQNLSGQTKHGKFTDHLKHLENFRFDQALEEIWSAIHVIDGVVNQEKLWVNTVKKLNILENAIENILAIAHDLKPFLPETAEKIEKIFKGSNLPTGRQEIKSPKPLFPRV